ncbi:MAG: tripartite tricarboxylate transporter TctB family protein [Chloroflexota bacterium]
MLVAGGLFLLDQAFQIKPAAGFVVVGPEVFPIIVSLWLIGLGGILALRTTLIPDWDLAYQATEEGLSTHWPTVWAVGGLLVVYALTLGPLGYILATAVFVPACARVLGSQSLLRDVAIGLGVAVVIFFFFTEVLEIRLPEGFLASVL